MKELLKQMDEEGKKHDKKVGHQVSSAFCLSARCDISDSDMNAWCIRTARRASATTCTRRSQRRSAPESAHARRVCCLGLTPREQFVQHVKEYQEMQTKYKNKYRQPALSYPSSTHPSPSSSADCSSSSEQGAGRATAQSGQA